METQKVIAMTPELTNILYIEDEEYLQQIVQMALERVGGFTVHLCIGGEQALAELDEFSPDLILLDVRLPKMSGPEVLEEIRKCAGFETTPVIFVTASVMDEDLDAYRNSGAIDVISKPFDPMKLSDEIRTIWKRHHDV